jgi:hypothetical protein
MVYHSVKFNLPLRKSRSSNKIKLYTSTTREGLAASKEEDDIVKVLGPASAVSVTSDEWIEVDKSLIPHNGTVEDAEEDNVQATRYS